MGGAVCLKTIAGRQVWPAAACMYVAFNSNLVHVACFTCAAARALGCGVSVRLRNGSQSALLQLD